MKFTFPMNNFSAGEWSPKLRRRTDLEDYVRACEEITNFIPTPQGGAQFRAGTKKITTANHASLSTATDTSHVIIPYKSSATGKSCTVMLYFASSLSVVASINGTSTTVSLQNMSSVGFPSELNILTEFTDQIQYDQVGDYLIITTGGSVTPLVFYWDTRASGGVGAYRFVTWMLARYLSFTANDHWTAIPWGPVYALGSGPTFTLSAVSVGTGRTLTMSSAFFETSSGGQEWVGVYIRGCNGTSAEGVAVISAWISSTQVTVTIIKAFPAAIAYGSVANPQSFWQIHAWGGYSGTSPGGSYPRTVASYQQRVFFGGNRLYPNTLWGSRAGNIFDFQSIPSPDTTGVFGFANDAYIADNTRPISTALAFDFSVICSMVSGKVLLINTDLVDVVAYGTDGAIGPNNITFESSSSYGSQKIEYVFGVPSSIYSPRAVKVDNHVVFADKTGTIIRDVVFNFDQSQYQVTNLSYTADHFFLNRNTATGKETVKDMVFISTPYPILYVLTTAGRLYGVTLDRDRGVAAWHRYSFCTTQINTNFPEFKHKTAPLYTDDRIMSICPNVDGTKLMMLAESKDRLGSTRVLLELQHPHELEHPGLIPSPYYGDGSHPSLFPVYLDTYVEAYSTSTTVSVGGIADNGELVDVVVDGNYVGQFTVSGTTITLTNAPTRHVAVGFRYPGLLKPMPLEAGGQYGPPIGRHKRVDEIAIDFFNSLGCKFGKDESSLVEIAFRQNSQLMGQPTDYFTGQKVETFPPGYERKFQVVIRQDLPSPCYIVGVTPRGMTYD